MIHEHTCYCGTAKKHPHIIGEDGFQRIMVVTPDYSDGTTEYSFKEQRGYFQHPCGCWSRWPGSENSING